MALEAWIQYSSMLATVVALIIKRHGMTKYIPVALFIHWYIEHVCLLFMNVFHLWTYPSRVVAFAEMSIPANNVVIPILAMFFVRYFPNNLKDRIIYVFIWSAALTIPEYFAERYTQLIKYHNSYDWYYTFILWIITFIILYAFHAWFWRVIKRFMMFDHTPV